MSGRKVKKSSNSPHWASQIIGVHQLLGFSTVCFFLVAFARRRKNATKLNSYRKLLFLHQERKKVLSLFYEPLFTCAFDSEEEKEKRRISLSRVSEWTMKKLLCSIKFYGLRNHVVQHLCFAVSMSWVVAHRKARKMDGFYFPSFVTPICKTQTSLVFSSCPLTSFSISSNNIQIKTKDGLLGFLPP